MVPSGRQLGFTLLEMIIVLSIILIMILSGMPAQKFFLIQSKGQVLRAQLLRAIALTRSEAMARHETITLCDSQDGKKCAGGWEIGYIIYSSDKILHVFQNTANNNGKIVWHAFPQGKKILEFLPSGFLNNQNGTFWYCAQSSQPDWGITISQSGRPRQILPDKNGEIVTDFKCY